MTEAELALQILQLAAQLGPPIATGIEELFATHRPDLLPPPPPRQDGAIAAEDEARIAGRFPSPR